jgi:YVTN family beta-propeller protein
VYTEPEAGSPMSHHSEHTMRTNVAYLTAGIALLAAAAMNAASKVDGARMLLFVDNSMGDDLTVIDLGTMKVVDTLKVGNEPHGLCAPADGRRLFVTIESEKNLKTIDTVTGKIVDTIPVTGRPNECAATPDGRYVGVPIRDGNSVDVVDTTQEKVVKVLPVKVPHNCFNSGSNNDMYVSSMGAHEINAIDLKTMAYSARIPVGGIPRPYAVSDDEKTLYAALTNLHGFAIADIPSRKVVQRVELPPAPPLNCPLEVNTPTHGLALTPDGKQLWVTSLADGGIYVYDLATRKISPMIHVGKCPNWITFSPDGKYCAVSNSDDDDCSIIDTHTRREVARLKTGKAPKRVLVVRVPAA